MKRLFSGIALALIFTAAAAEITGRIVLETDGDGIAGPGDRPLAGILVSDGHRFAVSDAAGNYRLPAHPKAVAVYVHRPAGCDTPVFFHRLAKEPRRYDFALTGGEDRRGKPIHILQVADSETADTSYKAALETFVANHPEIDMLFHAGDIHGDKGMAAHARDFAPGRFPRPVHFCVGNHDIVRRAAGEEDAYFRHLGPWYYSFEYGDFLFVTAPMYPGFTPPLPYDMLDYGDWLKALLARFPRHKKIMFAHDMVDVVGYEVPSRSGGIDLDRHGFRVIFYGHKHMNIARHYPSGRMAYSVNCPNRGGIGCFAPSFRVTRIDPGGGSESKLYFAELRELLHISLPNGDAVATGPDGQLLVSVSAYDSIDPPVRVTAALGDRRIELSPAGSLGWHGAFPADALPDGEPELTVTAAGVNRSWRKTVRFARAGTSGVLWMTPLPGDTALADPVPAGDRLLVAVADDANAKDGGIHCLERDGGRPLWFYRSGYSIRNNFRVDGASVYAIDSRGNIRAIELASGRRKWLNRSDERILSPSASGLAVADGVAAGGYGALLRGVDAATGATRWTNRDWVERTPGEDKLTVDGQLLLVISQLHGLCAHELGSGKLVWQFKQMFLRGTPCLDGDFIYVKGDHDFFKLARQDGAKAASVRPGALASGSVPVVYGELVIFGTAGKGLLALNKHTLKQVWQFLPGPGLLATTPYAVGKPPAVESTPALAGDRLYVGADDGRLYCLAAADGRLIGSYDLGAPVLGRPVVAGDRVYAADMTGRVYCFRTF